MIELKGQNQNDPRRIFERHLLSALELCPHTSWTAQPAYGYDQQRLSLQAIKDQLHEQAIRARNGVIIMFVGWGLNGRWPRTRNAPLFFTREVLHWALTTACHIWPQDVVSNGPPWPVSVISKFLDLTVRRWYSTGLDYWSQSSAEDIFDLQAMPFD